jgi:RNA polymerase sigma factor (sigma-70 family)
MDQAEPAMPQTLPAREAFAFEDAPRLTAALKRGDETAYAWLHERWSRRINRYCFALAAGDEALAAEFAQSTWLRIVRHIRELHDEAALWNWIACAARHAASDERRKGGRYLRALGRFANLCFAELFSTSPSSAAGDAGADPLATALDQALEHLTADERVLVEGRYFSGESLEAIGARLSISTRAVEGRLARLRQRLRELIAAQLRSPSPFS